MKKVIIIFYVLLLTSMAARANISGSITVTSDYLFKGVSLTDEKPALQPYIEYSNENGFYVSGWASNVDFRADNRDGQSIKYTSTEVDIASGYQWKVNNWLNMNAGAVGYVYFGSQNSIQANNSLIKASDTNYMELYLVATITENTTIGYWLAPKYSGVDNKHSIFLVSHNIALPANFNIQITANYLLNHDQNNVYQQGSADNYTHLSIGISKSIAKLDWLFSLETQNDKNDIGKNIRPVITVSYPF